MTYFEIMKEDTIVGIGYGEENDVSMYNDKFEYIEITKREYNKIDKEFQAYVNNKDKSR